MTKKGFKLRAFDKKRGATSAATQWETDTEEIKAAYAAGETDFGNAYVNDFDLSETDLSGASFADADLILVNFTGANLSNCAFANTNLRGCKFHGAILDNADMSGCNIRGAAGILAIGPVGSRGDMLYAVIHPDCLMVKTGCFWGTLDEFKAEVDEKYEGDPSHEQYNRAVIPALEAWYALEREQETVE